MTATKGADSPEDHELGGIRSLRVRLIIFVSVCVFAGALVVIGLVMARDSAETSSGGTVATVGSPLTNLSTASVGRPALLFENTAVDDRFGKVAVVTLDDPAGPRAIAEMNCDRIDFRAGRGVCLRSDRGLITTYDAVFFDEQLDETDRIGLAGQPSRVRLSPSGSLAAATVFVTGHSYAIDGFSTQTLLLDMATTDVIADLEIDFTVLRDGETWRSVDFNFWGVTFEDDEHFYATLGTGGDYYLVRGQVSERRMEVVHSGVECPSLSPDGTRIAYKVRSDRGLGPATWRIAVLDLATMESVVLAETRSVDDQVAWLDDSTVMYGLPRTESSAQTDTWAVAADGTGAPRLLVSDAWSVVRVD